MRAVLAGCATVVELDDDGLCCGAGGAWSVLQPELSGRVRDRKVAAIGRTGAGVVASANPGCILQLAAIELLRTAIEEGATDKPPAEKELVRAQRAVDKALRILRDLDDRTS